MERRDFFEKGLLASLAAMLPLGTEGNTAVEKENWKHTHLKSQPPLEAKEGMELRVWVRSAMTQGLFSSVECAVAPKVMGPPPHYHLELDELMYVAEGTASILVGDEVVKVEAGGWHIRPRMITHTFWNAETKPLRFYDMYFNQPFEEYLEKVFFELNDAHGYPEGSEKKIAALNALNEKFGLKFPAKSFQKRDELVKQFGLKP
jgi:mannose-6-phosphate isomerase-like protein (cupin superfamily)